MEKQWFHLGSIRPVWPAVQNHFPVISGQEMQASSSWSSIAPPGLKTSRACGLYAFLFLWDVSFCGRLEGDKRVTLLISFFVFQYFRSLLLRPRFLRHLFVYINRSRYLSCQNTNKNPGLGAPHDPSTKWIAPGKLWSMNESISGSIQLVDNEIYAIGEMLVYGSWFMMTLIDRWTNFL